MRANGRWTLAVGAAGALLLAGHPAAAQGTQGTQVTEKKPEPELATDRPDFTETSVVVPKGSLQLESGVTFTNGPQGAKSFGGPELLLRLGVLERTELRIGAPDYVWSRGPGGSHRAGFGDLYLGFKQQLGPTKSGFDFALIPGVFVPTGADGISSGGVDPDLAFTWTRDLDDRTSIGGLFAFGWPTDGGDRNFTWGATVSLARSLGGRWGTFLEYAVDVPERGGDGHLLHHGYTYSLTRLSQLDLHFGFGISRAAPDFFIGGGYSIRF